MRINWTVVPVELDQHIIDELRVIAHQNKEFEACGFVLTCGEILEIYNISSEPQKSFIMDPAQQLEAMKKYGNGISGVWHTHPSGSRWPSKHDEEGVRSALASYWHYWIATKDGVYEYIWSINNATALQS